MEEQLLQSVHRNPLISSPEQRNILLRCKSHNETWSQHNILSIQMVYCCSFCNLLLRQLCRWIRRVLWPHFTRTAGVLNIILLLLRRSMDKGTTIKARADSCMPQTQQISRLHGVLLTNIATDVHFKVHVMLTCSDKEQAAIIAEVATCVGRHGPFSHPEPTWHNLPTFPSLAGEPSCFDPWRRMRRQTRGSCLRSFNAGLIHMIAGARGARIIFVREAHGPIARRWSQNGKTSLIDKDHALHLHLLIRSQRPTHGQMSVGKSHFMREFTGKMPEARWSTLIKHRPYSYRKIPWLWTHCLVKNHHQSVDLSIELHWHSLP